MIAFRYVLIFTLPIAIALVLYYATTSLRMDAHQNAWKWLDAALSTDADTRDAANKGLQSGEISPSLKLLNYISTASIILGAFMSALLVPVGSSVNRSVNLISAMVIGFCFTKMIVGFSYLGWVEFSLWLVIGFGGALVVTKLRGALILHGSGRKY